MELNLKKLQEIGAFVGPPVKKSIKWSQVVDDGSKKEFEGDVYIRRNSCATFDKDLKSHIDGKEASASKIFANVCTKDGKPLVNYEEALDLGEGLTGALLGAIFEVNSAKN